MGGFLIIIIENFVCVGGVGLMFLWVWFVVVVGVFDIVCLVRFWKVVCVGGECGFGWFLCVWLFVVGVFMYVFFC